MTYFITSIIFLLPSYLVRFSIFGIPTTMLEVLIYTAFIWTIVQQIRNPKSEILNKFKIQNLKTKTNLYLIPIILFIISGIISVIIAPDKREALGLFKAYIVDPIIFFYIIINFGGHPERAKDLKNIDSSARLPQNDITIFLIKSLILSGVLVALHAIWQKFTGDVASDGRVLGIFGLVPDASPNYLAFYLAPILVLVHSVELQIIGDNLKNFTKVYNKIWYYDLAFAILAYAIYLTGSRAAIGATVVGMGSYYVIKYWQKIRSSKIFLFLVTLSLVALLLIGWQQTKPNWNLTNTQGGRVTSSNNIRWEIYKTTVKDILPHNLVWLKGVGLGNYQPYFTELTKDRVNFPEWIAPKALTPHNLFLNIWVNLGLLGLISFVWILINFFKVTSNQQPVTSKKQTNQALATCYMLLVTMIITILIQGLVDSPVWKNDLVIIFWLLIALAYLNRSKGDK